MTKIAPVEKGSLIGKPNRYGHEKEWDGEGKNGESFVSADESLAYVSTPKTVVAPSLHTTEEGEEVVEAQPESEDTKFQKVDYKKRYDDLKRHYDKKLKEHGSEVKDLKEQLNANAPKYKPPTSPEELEQFKKDNPSIYNVIESVAHLQAQEELATLQGTVNNLSEELELTRAEKAFAELLQRVPDFDEIRHSPDFHEWAESQPAEIQNWVYRNSTDVDLAVQAINLYKASRGSSPSESYQPPAYTAADEVRTRRTVEEPSSNEKIWTRSEIKSLSPDQFEAHEAEIQRAMAEGRIQNV